MRKLIAYLTAASMLLSFEARAMPNSLQQPSAQTAPTQGLEDKLKAIKDHDNKQLVTDADLAEYRKRKISLENLLAVASVQKYSKSIFCRDSFRNYIFSGGTYSYVNLTFELAGQYDEGIIVDTWADFNNRNSGAKPNASLVQKCLLNFVVMKKELEKIVDSKGRPFYRISSYLMGKYCDVNAQQVVATARAVLDEKGLPLFRNEEDLLEYTRSGGTAEYANVLRREFNIGPRDLIDLKKSGADTNNFRKFIKETGLGTSTAAYYFVLGIDSAEKLRFRDTAKPNALVVYGTFDPDGALRNTAERQILEKIRQAYDLKVSVINTRDQFYEAAGATPDIMLLGINEHSGVGLLDDRLFLKDKELRFIFEGLHPNASIYFATCGGNRLAKQVPQLSPGRKVFSTHGGMYSTEVVIESLIPFRMKFFDHTKDVTVVYGRN